MFKIIHKVADWFSDGGISVLTWISYIFMLIFTFLEPIGAIVVVIVVEGLDAGAIVGILLGAIVLFFINLVICGFILGFAQFCDECISTRNRVRQISHEIKEEKKTETKEIFANNAQKKVIVQKEPEKQVSYEKTEIDKGFAVFLMNYFGSDNKHNPVRISAGTVVKIIQRNDNATYDVEYDDEGKKRVVTSIQPHYMKINK